jgi:hypothetical protein
VLLCELVYKRDWDLPGGVVERGESPRDCLRREVLEELGIDIEVGDLLTVDWLPPWAGWDDACLLMFDLGRIDAALTSRMRLQPREIAAVHWADADVARRHCRPQVADRLELATSGKPVPPFLHSGRQPTDAPRPYATLTRCDHVFTLPYFWPSPSSCPALAATGQPTQPRWTLGGE